MLRRSILAVSLGVIGSASFAQSSEPVTWASILESTQDCVARSEPDFERAISCYDVALGHCMEKVEYKSCLEDAVNELERLLPLYNAHERAEEISMQFDPARCHEFAIIEHDLPREEFLLQCKFTALATQVTAGHIASIWGQLHFQD